MFRSNKSRVSISPEMPVSPNVNISPAISDMYSDIVDGYLLGSFNVVPGATCGEFLPCLQHGQEH